MRGLAKFRAGVLNIKLLNPNGRDYLGLFRDLAQLKKPVVIRGTRCGKFGQPKEVEENKKPIA